MAATYDSTILPPPDPTKAPPPTPQPKDPLPIATSTLPKELQNGVGLRSQPPIPNTSSPHYFGVWTVVGVIIILVAAAIGVALLLGDRHSH